MGQPVVISLTVPKWLPEAAEWPRCHLISPRWAYFLRQEDRTEVTVAEFTRQYTEQLDGYGPAKIARILHMIARQHAADSLILLCHESDVDRCHRGMFARWLMERTGEIAGELAPASK